MSRNGTVAGQSTNFIPASAGVFLKGRRLGRNGN